MEFKGKYVVVSGGTSGIGSAVVKKMLDEGAEGVAIFSKNAKQFKQAEDKLIVKQVELLNLKEVEKFYKALPYERINILVVAAAISKPSFHHAVEEDDLRELVDTNLIGAYYTVKYALSKMRPGSSIVFIGSISATLGQAGFSIYCATKAGIVSLARTLAAELQDREIRVNCVSPGMVDTPMLDKLGLTQVDKENFAKSLAPRRAAKPNEIAEVVAFVASDRASYINAENIVVDGGACGIFGGKPEVK